MKRKVRLTESDLHRVIKESVRNVLNEYNYYDDNEEFLDYGPAIYDDGTTLHDARTFGKSYEEIQDDERSETLNYKKRKNDNYEVYRYMNSETLMYNMINKRGNNNLLKRCVDYIEKIKNGYLMSIDTMSHNLSDDYKKNKR